MSRSSREKAAPGAILFDPTGGLSGDMLLGALFALGADPRDVRREVSRLPGLEPFRVVFGRVRRKGISAVRVRIECGRKAGSRDLAKILSMIRRSGLDRKIRDAASETFKLLGRAEGKIHGVPLERVHFHEVGAVDSIVDIVGACVALSGLGWPALYHRPFRLGSGLISISHGKLPLPAPATLEVLRGRTVIFGREECEMVTPTGAALMRTLAEELPADAVLVPGRTVYAAGTRERHPGPGILRATEIDVPSGEGFVTVIRSTIDDMNPEVFGYLQERLFEAGALEVYLTQVIMKKNRPGILLTVLCDRGKRDRLVSIIFAETTTLGMRLSTEGRAELERWSETVRTPYGSVMVKYGMLPGGEVKAAPEYESCRKLALEKGVPIGRVYDSARASASKRPRDGGKR